MVSFLVVLYFLYMLSSVNGHGYMLMPPSRSYLWKEKKFKPLNPHENYNYMGLNCGGLSAQTANNGQCGICGDGFKGPKENEPGPQGRFAQGIISKCYTSGRVLEVTVRLTSNHLGWMEWRLCKHNDPKTTVNQACLDKNVLKIADTSGVNWNRDGKSRLKIKAENKKSNDYFRVSLIIPNGLRCDACVLQWIYKAGNNWGCDEVNGERVCGIGHGDVQEEFRNCADIAIRDNCPNNILDLPLNRKINQHSKSESGSHEIKPAPKIPKPAMGVHRHFSTTLQRPEHLVGSVGSQQSTAEDQKQPLQSLHNQLLSLISPGRQDQNHLSAVMRPLEGIRAHQPNLILHSSQRHDEHNSLNQESGLHHLMSGLSRHIGTCELKHQNSPVHLLKSFCSDRNCQVDYNKNVCICY